MDGVEAATGLPWWKDLYLVGSQKMKCPLCHSESYDSVPYRTSEQISAVIREAAIAAQRIGEVRAVHCLAEAEAYLRVYRHVTAGPLNLTPILATKVEEEIAAAPASAKRSWLLRLFRRAKQ